MKEAMDPFGKALSDYMDGKTGEILVMEREDGYADGVPVSIFFREPEAFFPVEKQALERCGGRVLDIGAGTGIHSLALQSRGFSVTAVDVAPLAVDVMKRQGVSDARCEDVFDMAPESFDTVLLLCHGIGIVGSVEGLDRFLHRMKPFMAEDGQLLINSLDVTQTDDPAHLAYHASNRRSGRLAGDIKIRIRYDGMESEWFHWIQFDRENLAEHAAAAGWAMEVIAEDAGGGVSGEIDAAASMISDIRECLSPWERRGK